MSQVVVLGATGSIGSQALDVISHLGWSVDGLAANRPSRRLAELARRYPDTEIVVAAGDDAEARDFASRVDNPVAFGPDAVAEMASRPGRIVVNGIVGAAGLRATLAALHAGNRVALANKESLVAGGPLVMGALAEAGELIPVDSEHSALHQCLEGEDRGAVSRLVLTASGGPFRGRSRQELVSVSVEEALAHPTWRMGGRITVDSATLMNKGLEVIEAHHLFDVDLDRIDVVVHPQSIVHSAVEFVDGSLKAHIGHPDMRIPIQYALTYPKRATGWEPFSFVGRTLEFGGSRPPDLPGGRPRLRRRPPGRHRPLRPQRRRRSGGGGIPRRPNRLPGYRRRGGRDAAEGGMGAGADVRRPGAGRRRRGPGLGVRIGGFC